MLLPRIALTLLFILAFAGFRTPNLPQDSRGVYNLEPVTSGAGYKTQTGGLFSLTVGLKKNSLGVNEKKTRHRDRAQMMIKKLEKHLEKFSGEGVDITVGRIYTNTREIILNIQLEDPDKVDAVRTELISLLQKLPGVLFVGQPASLEVEK